MARVPILGAILVTLLVGAVPAGAAGTVMEPGGTFFDDDGSVHEGAIEAVAAEAITLGCDQQSTVFCPSDAVTRAQMATFLARALDLPAATTDHFQDDTGSIHEPAINQVADANISLGCGGTNYCPSDAVTRAQMATFLARALDLAPVVPEPRPSTTEGLQLGLFEFTNDCDDPLDCPAAVSVPPGVPFFVSEGWDLDNWSISSDLDRDAFASPSTRAVFTLNGGDPLRTVETVAVDESDVARKRFSFQFPATLNGAHELEVRWYQTDVLTYRVVAQITIEG